MGRETHSSLAITSSACGALDGRRVVFEALEEWLYYSLRRMLNGCRLKIERPDPPAQKVPDIDPAPKPPCVEEALARKPNEWG